MLFCIKKKSCIKKYSDKTEGNIKVDNKLNNDIIEAEYIKPCQSNDNILNSNDNQSSITINLINEYFIRLKILWDKKDKLLELPEVMDTNNVYKRNIYTIEIMDLEKRIFKLTKLLN